MKLVRSAVNQAHAAEPRVLLIADVSNLYYTIKKRFERRLDYAKLYYIAESYGKVIVAIAFGAQMNDEAKDFINYLQAKGYITKYRAPKVYALPNNKEHRKADWDVGITVDIMNRIDQFDTLILGSADADMMDLIKHLQSIDKKVVIIACNISADIKSLTDYIEITEDFLEIK